MKYFSLMEIVKNYATTCAVYPSFGNNEQQKP